jgi:hypothetical protein
MSKPIQLVHPAYHEDTPAPADEELSPSTPAQAAMPAVERTSILDSMRMNHTWRYGEARSRAQSRAMPGAPTEEQVNELEACHNTVAVIFELLEADIVNENCENSERLDVRVRSALLEAIRIANDRAAEVTERVHTRLQEALEAFSGGTE